MKSSATTPGKLHTSTADVPPSLTPVAVMKFGGTSVANAAAIRRCAERVIAARTAGCDVVVVVSAMGHTTDTLIALARDITDAPSRREMDMLLATGEQVSIALMTMALHAACVAAVSMTGPQLGIVTDEVHSRARIRSIDAVRIQSVLDSGRVVVAAGFQGMTAGGDITTLGRGGSDTTAVALAAALKAHDTDRTCSCDIFTDVTGVFTADPRVVTNARLLDEISFEEMLELAALGAGVMSHRAVAFGQKYNMPIRVRHASGESPGTLIREETIDMEMQPVTGCAMRLNIGRISLRDIPNQVGVQAQVFRQIADRSLIVDDILQTESQRGINLSFTVDQDDLAEVRAAADAVIAELGSGSVGVEIGLGKVSVVGAGMQSQPGVASTMFSAIADAGIAIRNITTSEIKISCIVAAGDAPAALQIVHDAFNLHVSP
ncbi:MAG: aspartate kinase [Phycisphaerales bacterium]